ncbi:MAG: aminopeptidase N [Proteobacteria bacterium]|nr:aminopeptidase N [Pseudomonadota bacterium]
MRDANPPVIRLVDYERPEFHTVETRLAFDLAAGSTEVTSTLKVERYLPGGDGPLVLDGEMLDLISVSVDGELLAGNEYSVDDEQLVIPNLKDAVEIRIVTRIHPEENLALEGLYKSSGMYCTQCEAQGFRRITYYQDRPDILSRFTTSITADSQLYPNLLSNGNLIEDKTNNGRRTVVWEDPFPKPSYLFALVAGDLACLKSTFTTMSRREVRLEIYTEPHNIGQCDYAMDALKRAMAWDEQRFGREYDLDIFMIVAVEDFNMGAMENKGLNIFNTSCVLASPDTATDAAYERVEAVVAHEYFHNWSGNRVTCRDWFQLSLKEGFTVFRDAEFSSDMGSRTVKRIDDVTFLRSIQFAEDAGPLAHPVRPASYIEISNFYTTTIYEKGAEVVGMIHTLLGEEGFRKGCDVYFDRHDGEAVTTEDFVVAMEEANDVDLSQFRLWYTQAGTPVLKVEQREEGSDLVLRVHQSCPPTPGAPDKAPFHMPLLLGLIGVDGQPVDAPVISTAPSQVRPEGVLVHLQGEETEVRFKSASEATVSFLRGFSAPVRVDYPRSRDALIHLAKYDSDGFARWDALQSLLVEEIPKVGAGEPISGGIVELFEHLVNSALVRGIDAEERKLLATMLTLPDAGYLFEQIRPAQVEQVCDGLDRFALDIGSQLNEALHTLYEMWSPDGPYAPDSASMGARALRNRALAYLAHALDQDRVQTLLDTHLNGADNLTDRSAALRTMCVSGTYPAHARQDVLSAFFDRFKDEALVVNLWFSMQASSDQFSISDLQALEKHPAFDVRNPNRARSIYAAFGQNNHRRLHAADGSGYGYLAERIARLDVINPQVAARLAIPLTRWKRYTPARGQQMVSALESLAQRDNPSKDLFEVVTKSLEN